MDCFRHCFQLLSPELFQLTTMYISVCVMYVTDFRMASNWYATCVNYAIPLVFIIYYLLHTSICIDKVILFVRYFKLNGNGKLFSENEGKKTQFV